VAGADLLPLLPQRFRPAAFVVFPLAALALVLTTPLGTVVTLPFAHYELVVLQVTQLSRAFGIIFALIAFMGGVYSLHMRETGQQAGGPAIRRRRTGGDVLRRLFYLAGVLGGDGRRFDLPDLGQAHR
jgi:formate hydrogenlyase subunit 3/multisubunit Na+/H+ antiporter MnhD subunit